MTIEERARQFIFHKEKWQKAGGQPFRSTLKHAYQMFETDLIGDLPDNYRIDGKVLIKGKVVTVEKDYPYIAIYTEASFSKRGSAFKKFKESEIKNRAESSKG